MTNPEDGKRFLVDTATQILQPPTRLSKRKSYQERQARAKHRAGFIAAAERLLENFGEDQELEGRWRSLKRLTRPVEVVVGDQRVVIQVGRFVYGLSDTYSREELALFASTQSQDRAEIFSLEQSHYLQDGRDKIAGRPARNYQNKPASDREMAGALNAVVWLESQLNQ